ncbi:MAG: acyl carrier protein [Kofleriaceae bacterium]
MRDLEASIRRYLATFHPGGRAAIAKLSPTTNLWTEVSSLTMLQLVAYLEQKFEIQVRPIDFAPQNFSTIAAITKFVASRRSPQLP